MAALGLGLLLIGFGFKVAAVPFHMWAPDVYDGSPTPVTGFMATGVKAAAFAALVRVLMEAFPSAVSVWQPIVAALAIASMVLGNLVALTQRSLKRMLAYSSIAHAGYLLTAAWPGSPAGAGAVLLYLLAYSLTTLAAFGFLAALGRGGEREVTFDDIAGLARHASRYRLRADRLHALAAGLPRNLRVHRQVVHPDGGRRRGALHPAGGRGAHERRERGLLPAGHHGDVHEVRPDRRSLCRRAAQPRGARRRGADGRGRARCSGYGPGAMLDLAAKSAATLTQTGLPFAGP